MRYRTNNQIGSKSFMTYDDYLNAVGAFDALDQHDCGRPTPMADSLQQWVDYGEELAETRKLSGPRSEPTLVECRLMHYRNSSNAMSPVIQPTTDTTDTSYRIQLEELIEDLVALTESWSADDQDRLDSSKCIEDLKWTIANALHQ